MLKRKTLCDNFVAERFLDGLRRNGLVLDAVVLLRAFGSKHASNQTEAQPQPVTDTERKYVYGILGIAKLFGCSLPTCLLYTSRCV